MDNATATRTTAALTTPVPVPSHPVTIAPVGDTWDNLRVRVLEINNAMGVVGGMAKCTELVPFDKALKYGQIELGATPADDMWVFWVKANRIAGQ
jgi:hypothetical protein